MTLSWSQPLDNGGCPVTSFGLFINDGLGDTNFT
jgi:hypothetical protein